MVAPVVMRTGQTRLGWRGRKNQPWCNIPNTITVKIVHWNSTTKDIFRDWALIGKKIDSQAHAEFHKQFNMRHPFGDRVFICLNSINICGICFYSASHFKSRLKGSFSGPFKNLNSSKESTVKHSPLIFSILQFKHLEYSLFTRVLSWWVHL